MKYFPTSLFNLTGTLRKK